MFVRRVWCGDGGGDGKLVAAVRGIWYVFGGEAELCGEL